MRRPMRPEHKLGRIILGLIVLATALGIAYATSSPPSTPNVPRVAAPATAQTQLIGSRTKTTGCQINGALQDPGCTPGAMIPTATTSQICVSGYSKSVRNVPASEKDAVYAEYGITSHVTGQYDVDHLISLELGGSNDIANLWPEAASPTPGFHQKDVVENALHDEVCSGQISLTDAQKEIATNWLPLYTSPTVPGR